MPYIHGFRENTYRPNYGPPAPPPLPRQPPNPNGPRDYDNLNPNQVPLGPRRVRTPALAPSVTSSDRLPQLWDPALDSLMGRTTRAYDLVCSYARHCPGGSRWSSDRIAEIREQGQHLHEEVRDLRYWQRRAAQDEHLGEDTMNKIHVTAERVREMCEQVQACIMGYERVPEGQRLTPSLAREDWPSQAEAGNGEGDGREPAPTPTPTHAPLRHPEPGIAHANSYVPLPQGNKKFVNAM